ncbi:MAG: F0F1 ATP synthase subunit alpha [Acidiphilium sp.]|nr:F0F1 ATP synthase subunit alpha [Acidiphilium sp.]
MEIRPAEISEILKKQIASFDTETDVAETGQVLSVGDGIARVFGLTNVLAGEMVDFPNAGVKGMALNLETDNVGIVIFGEDRAIREGDTVTRTGQIVDVPVGKGLLGRVVDALGNPIDGKGPIETTERRLVEVKAPGIMPRQSVTEPMMTGLKAIDALVPVGRGQRELIIGDRQTGKTTLTLDAIINQKGKNVFCVYCWVGGAHASLMKVIHALQEMGALEYTVVVAASASSSAGEQYLAPYVAAAMGEYFMYSGRDSLVVFDDLTKHAWIYRELSLLLERSPGREAYPGDIFYLHSQLMERAGRLNSELGSGSMSFLPIVETLQGDITGYVQSNLVSMTDGQVYISSSLFHEGFKPAIDLGLSVSRIGSKVQSEALREVSDTLRLDYAQYKELIRLMRVKTKLSTEIAEKLRRGEALTRVLVQDAHKPVSDLALVIQLYAFKRKILEILSPEGLSVFLREIMNYLAETRPQVLKTLEGQKILSVETKQELDRAFVEFFREKKIV